jgi:hypothetical protein
MLAGSNSGKGCEDFLIADGKRALSCTVGAGDQGENRGRQRIGAVALE